LEESCRGWMLNASWAGLAFKVVWNVVLMAHITGMRSSCWAHTVSRSWAMRWLERRRFPITWWVHSRIPLAWARVFDSGQFGSNSIWLKKFLKFSGDEFCPIVM
jgi:hypothetical protein